jgi:hypothetical protein
MRFTLEHRFDAPLDVVEKAANSAEFLTLVEQLPNVGTRKVTELTENPDGTIHRITNYSLDAQLPAPVVAVLGKTATWDEVADYDPSTHTWTFVIKPHVLGGRLDCKGSYTLSAETPASTKRTVDLDIKVKVPFVGGRVEGEIRNGLVESLEAEATLLAEYVTR